MGITFYKFHRPLIWIFIFATGISAQGPDTLWTKTYGGYYREYGYSVQQTNDGGYIVVGTTQSYGAGGYDIWLLKLDINGDTTWTKTYGGYYDEIGCAVQQTTDGGFIIVGKKNNYGSTYDDFWLVKTDINGDTIWTRSYGGNYNEIGRSGQQTSDGGYVIVGSTRSYGQGTPTYTNIYLVKTDTNGDTIWTRVFGDSGFVDDYAYDITQTSDGGYIIAGCSGLDTEFDLYLVKVNSDGDTLWTKKYGGSGQEIGYSVIESGGGYIVAGYTNSYGPNPSNYYLLKIALNGDTIWTRVYNGGGDEHAHSVQETYDGGYIIAGYTELPNVYQQDFYLVKTDAYGNTIWTKVYPKAYHSDVPYQIQQTNDNGYIIVGYTHYWYFGEPRAYEQIYVIKTNPAGGIEEHHTGCKKTSFKIIPNPVVGSAIIEYGIPRSTLLTITIYNSLGQKIKTLSVKDNSLTQQIMWNGFDDFNNKVPSGIYFVRFGDTTEKLIKIK
jgi:hypothetical protein|uniref:T9SS type A sorting domain-containing protein n=1 Tax=candidate division WOR-3 bacterium TaxID=2052148 RepID=A0A7C6EJB4_UNCW3